MALANNLGVSNRPHEARAGEGAGERRVGKLFPVLESEASLARQNAESGFMSLTDGQLRHQVRPDPPLVSTGNFLQFARASRAAYAAAKEEVRRVKGNRSPRSSGPISGRLPPERMITAAQGIPRSFEIEPERRREPLSHGSVPRFELLQALVQLKGQEPLLLEAENNYVLMLLTPSISTSGAAPFVTSPRIGTGKRILPDARRRFIPQKRRRWCARRLRNRRR